MAETHGEMGRDRVGPPVAGIEELDIDGGVTLYHPTLDQAIVLNATASDVWRLCDGERTLEQIVALLARTYGVEEFEIRAEIAGTVQRFEHEGILGERRP